MSYLVFSEVRALQRRTEEAEAAMTSWKVRFTYLYCCLSTVHLSVTAQDKIAAVQASDALIAQLRAEVAQLSAANASMSDQHATAMRHLQEEHASESERARAGASAQTSSLVCVCECVCGVCQ